MKWPRRRAKSPEVDYVAAMRESGYLYDRVTSITREAHIAANVLDVARLEALKAEQEMALARMREIAREVGAR